MGEQYQVKMTPSEFEAYLSSGNINIKDLKVINLTRNVPKLIESFDKRKILFSKMIAYGYAKPDVREKFATMKFLDETGVWDKEGFAEYSPDEFLQDGTYSEQDIEQDIYILSKEYNLDNTDLQYLDLEVRRTTVTSYNLYETFYPQYCMAMIYNYQPNSINRTYLKTLFNDTNIIGLSCNNNVTFQIIYFNANDELIHKQNVTLTPNTSEILMERSDYMYFYFKYSDGPENININIDSVKSLRNLDSTDILNYNLENNIKYKINQPIVIKRNSFDKKIDFITPIKLYSNLLYTKFKGSIQFNLEILEGENVKLVVKNSPIQNSNREWYQDYINSWQFGGPREALVARPREALVARPQYFADLEAMYSKGVLAVRPGHFADLETMFSTGAVVDTTSKLQKMIGDFLNSQITSANEMRYDLTNSTFKDKDDPNKIIIPLEYIGSQNLEFYLEFSPNPNKKQRRIQKTVKNFYSSFDREFLNMPWVIDEMVKKIAAEKGTDYIKWWLDERKEAEWTA
jgi:hypothetical protein